MAIAYIVLVVSRTLLITQREVLHAWNYDFFLSVALYGSIIASSDVTLVCVCVYLYTYAFIIYAFFKYTLNMFPYSF